MSTRHRTSLLTVRELVELYSDHRLPELHPRTQSMTAHILAEYVQDFGSSLVSDLTKRDLVKWLRDRPDLAPSTRKGWLNRVKSVYGWALEEDDLIERNPYARMTWEESRPRRAITDAEFQAAYSVSPPIFRRLLVFLHRTGCRPGEAAQLTWPMIHWEKRVAVIQEHKTARKTGRDREIFLSGFVVQFLRLLQESKRHPRAGDLVFHSRWGTKWTSCQMSVYWRAVRQAAGLPDDCYLYGLRHKFCSDLAVANVNIAYVSKLAGHTSEKTTMKHYVHMDQHREALLRTVDAM